MHSQGYFILSYDSLDLIHEVMAVEVEKNDAYKNTYYYDTKNSFSLFATLDTKERTMANIFPVKKANDEVVEKLKSINFALRGLNITAKIKIYVKDSLMSNPEDGELKLTQTVQIPNSGEKGFYTIDLDKEIILNKGQYFSIIVDVTNEGEKNVDLMASGETREILSFYKYKNQWVNSKNGYVVFGIKAHTLEMPITKLNKDIATDEENNPISKESNTSETESNATLTSESQTNNSVKTGKQTNSNTTTDESSVTKNNNSKKPKTNKTNVILWSILGALVGIATFGMATFFIVKLMKKRVKK